MRTRTAVVVALLGTASALAGISASPSAALPPGSFPGDGVVVQWNAAALAGVRTSKLGPPMVSRALAVVHTCIYDAWAAYDPVAVGTRLGGSLRQPASARTLANKNKAVSFAAYRAAKDLLPGSVSTVFDPLMAELGYNASDNSTNTSTPSGVGNVACNAVLDYRHRDGSNQLGDEPGGTPGVAYSDYAGYTPINDPMDVTRRFDPSTIHDPDRWQPLTYRDATGALVTPKFVGPYWNRVLPFALESPSALRSPTGPARQGSLQNTRELAELLAISSTLDDQKKVIAEYWADGPSSELPPGHWDLFAQFISRRDRHGTSATGLARDVKLFFTITNAIFDAGIVAWDDKVAFDSVRPITAIRNRFRGQKVLAWGGPYKGTQLIDGDAWLPYQPSTFPTPPFPEYASGHSNFSAAGARVLNLFTGSDAFNYSVTFPAGSSKVEPGAVPASALTLTFPTFSDAAAQAGISRRYGGIHFEQGDLDARVTGTRCADATWEKALALINGTAPPASPAPAGPLPPLPSPLA